MLIINITVALSTKVLTLQKFCEKRCFTCIKVAHTIDFFCLLLLYILLDNGTTASFREGVLKQMRWWKISNTCKIKRKLNATASQNQEWNESYTFTDREDKWLLLIHRFHRQVNVADPQTSDSWMFHIHRYLRRLDAASTDIWHSWILQIHRYRIQLEVAVPQISQTAGCCRSTDIAYSWKLQIHRYLRRLDAASTDIWHSWILQIHKYHRQLNVVNPQISQTARSCRSTDISNSWILIIHRFRRHLNAMQSRTLETEG